MLLRRARAELLAAAGHQTAPPSCGAPRTAAQNPGAAAVPRTREEAILHSEAGRTPADAFDALYVRAGGPLVYQVLLLTGSRRLAFEAVDVAFHRAWEHWPEVAADPDPAGWVRAKAHDYALAPWHRFRPAHQADAATAGDTAWQAFLGLPGHHRRVLMLCEGLGLDITQAAIEMEATAGATRSRLMHARTALSQHLPAPDDPGTPDNWLKDRTTAASTATLPRAHSVRQTSERLTRLQTRLAFALTATLAALIAITCATT
ncbi:RNA polymerase sigma factor [Streptomyces sp. NPDC058672]|uniref:RNA polymerase sigma factor n=1 Tax=Streptomyces sp. NPDC058672 TaxID=3346591 RepID=UPI0036483B21